jgi:hypothetical protein
VVGHHVYGYVVFFFFPFCLNLTKNVSINTSAVSDLSEAHRQHNDEPYFSLLHSSGIISMKLAYCYGVRSIVITPKIKLDEDHISTNKSSFAKVNSSIHSIK